MRGVGLRGAPEEVPVVLDVFERAEGVRGALALIGDLPVEPVDDAERLGADPQRRELRARAQGLPELLDGGLVDLRARVEVVVLDHVVDGQRL